MKNRLKELGFDKWFEKSHSLEGWRDFDQYLDEVELPDMLFLPLVQKWLIEVNDIEIAVQWFNKGYVFAVSKKLAKEKLSAFTKVYKEAFDVGVIFI